MWQRHESQAALLMARMEQKDVDVVVMQQITQAHSGNALGLRHLLPPEPRPAGLRAAAVKVTLHHRAASNLLGYGSE